MQPFTNNYTIVIISCYKRETNFMANENIQADGYYDEDANTSNEDFDLSFLDEDESEE